MKLSILSLLAVSCCLLTSALTSIQAKTYFKETFDSKWDSRWTPSTWKRSEGTAGDWRHTAGQWYGDEEADKGIQTSQDARFYAISSKFPSPIDNLNKDLIIQFQVKFPQKIDCGGGYIKILPSSVSPNDFGGDSPYEIMFGPDVCGTTTKRTHLIFTKDGQNHLIKKTIPCEVDQLSHVYTLILKSDNAYEVRIDGESKESGSLYEDWDILPAKMIKDPSLSKPADWIDDPMMDDPTDVKPEGYDETPRLIPDPTAEKPDDWDDDADGEWEAPQIDNPGWKGVWSAKKIANPDYKGEWKHPETVNPEYKHDEKLYHFSDLGGVGIELWQVKAGTMFDNIILTDDLSEAEEFFNSTWKQNKDAEKAMLEKVEQEQRDKEEAERKQQEEERKAREAADRATDNDDDDDDEDDDDDSASNTEADANANQGHEEL